MQSHPFPVTSSLLGPNIVLNTIFPNTLNFFSSLNDSDQVSNTYKPTSKIIVLNNNNNNNKAVLEFSTSISRKELSRRSRFVKK
jgi:hypothetical protein